MRSVSTDEWQLNLNPDDPRRKLLLSELSPEELIEQVIEQAKNDSEVAPIWCQCERRPGSGIARLEATIRLKKDTFDLLFNGRMGYRAQFYLSLDAGRQFNRRIVDGLIVVVGQAFTSLADLPRTWTEAERSLKAKDTKIWPHRDQEACNYRKPLLTPEMWKTNYENCRCERRRGLALADVKPPKFDLKGSWISHDSDEAFLPVDKRCRDELLRCFGFT